MGKGSGGGGKAVACGQWPVGKGSGEGEKQWPVVSGQWPVGRGSGEGEKQWPVVSGQWGKLGFEGKNSVSRAGESHLFRVRADGITHGKLLAAEVGEHVDECGVASDGAGADEVNAAIRGGVARFVIKVV